ncbi:hypothetical protein BRC91_10265 [Halobacteriales archaeon QS_4_62_28]|nr:MAG: hypothetical protein BRC91_10265 [Halobacteriales archaeon QS_4_62_28]
MRSIDADERWFEGLRRSVPRKPRAVMDTGSAGLAVGRDVWRRDGPEALLDALEDVICGGQPVESALS